MNTNLQLELVAHSQTRVVAFLGASQDHTLVLRGVTLEQGLELALVLWSWEEEK